MVSRHFLLKILRRERGGGSSDVSSPNFDEFAYSIFNTNTRMHSWEVHKVGRSVVVASCLWKENLQRMA